MLHADAMCTGDRAQESALRGKFGTDLMKVVTHTVITLLGGVEGSG